MTASLQSLTMTFEVVMRNRIHTSLSLQASEAKGALVSSFPWYDHREGWTKLEGETFDKVERLLCSAPGIRLLIPPTPDRVIASLSFGVWPNVLDAQLRTPLVEARTFLDVFPHHPTAKKHWRYGANRKAAVAVIKDVQNWRNRLAHCKPVWSEGWYRSSVAQHWTEMLQRLHSRRARVLEVLHWMCPATTRFYAQSFHSELFDQLATEAAVYAHISRPVNPWGDSLKLTIDASGLLDFKARK